MDEKPLKVYRHAGFLIPAHRVTPDFREAAEDRFTFLFYDEKACSKCPYLEDRHGENCDACGSYQGGRRLVKDVTFGERTYFSLPNGAADDVEQLVREHYPKSRIKVVNKHAPLTSLSRPVRLRKEVKLRPYQLEAIKAIHRHRVGVLKAPPRSGKTLMSLAAAMELGLKTIILATQKEWLLQFQETLIGSVTAPAMFTAHPEQVKLCKTFEDFRDTDICLATPQQFMSEKGKALLKRIRSLFPCMITDEVHLTPATQTSIVIAQFNAVYRIGLSGTPERKQEGLYGIVEDLIGPVIYEAKVERLRPTVEVLQTGISIKEPSRSQAGFTYFVNRLESNKKRLQLIANLALEKVKLGHTVMIPMQRIATIKALAKLINEEHGEREQIAVVFDGTLKKDARKRALEQIKMGERRIVVGNIRLLSTGLNIPRLSCLLEVTVSSNRPQAIQRTARILTPMEGKLTPLVVYLLDKSSFMRKTRRNEWWHAVMPEFKPHVPRGVMDELMAWFAEKEDGVPTARRLKEGI